MTTLEKLCRAACEAEGRNPDDEVDVNDWRRAAFPISIVVREWEVRLAATKAILTALQNQASKIAGNNTFDEELFNLCRADDYAGLFTAMIRKAKEG